jgi:hypothetical protein
VTILERRETLIVERVARTDKLGPQKQRRWRPK